MVRYSEHHSIGSTKFLLSKGKRKAIEQEQKQYGVCHTRVKVKHECQTARLKGKVSTEY